MRRLILALLILTMVIPVMAQVSFQLELYGGYAFLNPADLNLWSDFAEKYFAFWYDDYYEWIESLGGISDLEVEKSGEFARLKSGFPFGSRFKVLIGERFAVSLGVDYFSKTASSNPSFKYDFILSGSLLPASEEVNNQKYELFAKAVNPNLSFHYIIPELSEVAGSVIGAEVYAGAGILLADCSINWVYGIRSERPTYWRERSYDYKQDGSGKGVSLHAGARMNIAFAENIGVLFGGEYVYGKVKKVTGEGYSKSTYTSSLGTSSSRVASWEGDWYIFETSPIERPWGYYKMEFPYNDPNGSDFKTRDFVLDLSAFRVIFGFFLKF